MRSHALLPTAQDLTKMLELRAVSKSYGGHVALQTTNLTIPAGRTTVLIGPSGCGKSTLLRLMVGLLRPDTGLISFAGEEIAPANIHAVRRRIGYVVQDGGLFPHLTAYRNVTLMSQYIGWKRERAEARIATLAELTQFPRAGLDRYPAELSGGQKQRVSLMRALMLDPDVLLLDEPLGALDPMIRFDLQADLRRIFQSLQKTVVLVTHDIGEAAYFADLIVLMRDGAIIQQGTLDDLTTRPADPFVSRFINAQRRTLEILGQSSS